MKSTNLFLSFDDFITGGNYLFFVDVWHFRFHTHKGVKNGQPLDVAASNGGAQAVIFVMISQLH